MLLRNTLVNLGSLIFQVGVALLTTALLAKRLGPAAFGVLALVRSIVGNTGILETLFGAGITRYVAFLSGRGEAETRDRYVASGMLVNFVQGIAISICGIGFALVLFDDVFKHIPVDLLREARGLLLIFFIVFSVQVISITLTRALEGFQAYPVVRFCEALVQTLTLGLLWSYFRWFPQLPLHNLAWIYFGVEFGRLALLAGVIRRYGVHPLAGVRHADFPTLRALFAYGKPLFFAKLATLLSYRGDALVIGIFLTVDAIANYQVAYQIWAAATAGMAALTTALFPAIAHHAGRGRSVQQLFLRASRYCLAVSICVGILAALGRSMLIRYWVGPAYAQADVLILLFMMQLVLAYHQGVSSIAILGTDTHHSIGKFEAVGGIANIAVSLLLIRRIGPAAVVLGAIVRAIVITPMYTSAALKAVSLSPAAFFRESIFPVWRFFGVSAVVIGSVALGARLFAVTEMQAFWFEMVIVTAVLMALMWWMVLDSSDRKRLAALSARAH